MDLTTTKPADVRTSGCIVHGVMYITAKWFGLSKRQGFKAAFIHEKKKLQQEGILMTQRQQKKLHLLQGHTTFP